MKKQKQWLYSCLILLSSIATQIIKAQTYCSGSSCEMVYNGGFEIYSPAPTLQGQITYAAGWSTIGSQSSPDLFTATSPTASGYSIPCNISGYQLAHSGSAYVGLFHGYPGGGGGAGWKWAEDIYTEFCSGLVVGTIYDVSFYVNKADLGNYEYNNMRVDIGYTTYTISPTLTNDPNWMLVSFSHCPSVDEYSLKIYCDELPETLTTYTPVAGCTYTNPAGSYIYIDDISVKEAKFTVATQTVCLNTPVTVTAVPTCTLLANYTYTWNYGDGSSVSTTTVNSSTHSYTAFGTYNGTLTVGAGACTQTYTYNIYVPTLSVAVTTNTNTICNSTANFTATPSPSGSYTYTWVVTNAATGATLTIPGTGTTTATPTLNFAGNFVNVNVCAIITNTLGCTTTNCLLCQAVVITGPVL